MSLEESEKVCEQRTTGIRGSLRGPRGPKNNYEIYHNITILAENKYCIHNRDYDHLFLIMILE